MGKRTSYELFGWAPSGSGLPTDEKEALQDRVIDLGFEEWASNCDESESYIVGFPMKAIMPTVKSVRRCPNMLS